MSTAQQRMRAWVEENSANDIAGRLCARRSEVYRLRRAYRRAHDQLRTLGRQYRSTQAALVEVQQVLADLLATSDPWVRRGCSLHDNCRWCRHCGMSCSGNAEIHYEGCAWHRAVAAVEAGC